MANYEAQIKPAGLKQKSLVDCLYALASSIQGICKKLDLDGGVPLGGGGGVPAYETDVFTANFNGSIENSRGEVVMNAIAALENDFKIVSPRGITFASALGFISQILEMLHDLTKKLDDDTLSDSDYKALVYDAYTLEYDDDSDNIGSLLGMNLQKITVDYLYACVKAIDVLTKKLDLDGTVTDVTYEALWDTANILMQVENSRGDVAGNALTKFNP